MTGFQIPTLEDWRRRGRGYVLANLPPRSVILPNSPMRVITDGSSGLSFMVMLYLAELADQLLPDTAQGEWLRRHAAIWLKGGAKGAAYAVGAISLTGVAGRVVAQGETFTVSAADGSVIIVETVSDVTVGGGPTPVAVRALTSGAVGNLDAGTQLSVSRGQQGLSSVATVIAMSGGVDAETDDELRVRVLDRIQKPPMGGDADDYVQWALSFPGVTRAWCSPNEMGVGTVTVRFMMDDLRATTDPLTNGFPLPQDAANLKAYLDTVRPVAMKDLFVERASAGAGQLRTWQPRRLLGHDRAAILASVSAMLKRKAAPAFALNGVGQPAQTIFASWVSTAVSAAAGVNSFDLIMADHVMPTNGSMAVIGSITAATP